MSNELLPFRQAMAAPTYLRPSSTSALPVAPRYQAPLVVARTSQAVQQLEYIFFTSPTGAANLRQWARQDFLSIDNALPILWGRDPGRVDLEKIKDLAPYSARAKLYLDDLETLVCSFESGSLTKTIAPTKLVAWAKSKGIAVSPAFEQLVHHFWPPANTTDWRAIAHTLGRKIQHLEHQNGEAVALIPKLLHDLDTARLDHGRVAAALVGQSNQVTHYADTVAALHAELQTAKSASVALRQHVDELYRKSQYHEQLAGRAMSQTQSLDGRLRERETELQKTKDLAASEKTARAEELQALKGKLHQATDEIARLTEAKSPGKPQVTSAAVKEKNNAQRLAFGLIKAHYMAEAGEMDKPNFKKICDDLEVAGVRIDDETVQKHWLAGSQENSR